MGSRPRIRLDQDPGLQRICDEYADLLHRHGFGAEDGYRYVFDVLPNGSPIDPQLRVEFRHALAAAEAGDAFEPPDPFDPASADAFHDWADRHRAAQPRRLRRHAADAPAASPSADGSPPQLAPRRRRGVNVIGYLEAELGLGEIARKLVAAAERAGIPLSTVTCRDLVHRQTYPFDERGDGPVYDTNIVCVNADKLPDLVAQLGPAKVAGRYAIGVWFWETAHFPATMHSAFDHVDEVWVASDFVRASISAETRKPVHVVPIPLAPEQRPSLTRTELNLPEGFLYLFSFDYFSVFERKNPIAVVEAFKRAFPSGDGPWLLIRSINGDHHLAKRELLEQAAAGRADIRIVDGYVSPAERDALMASCDCYVSLHRSEGLGLTMAEAMAFGKPVVATAYSGNLTFMDERNSYLVRYRMTTVPEHCDPYTPGVEWADPDLDHAAELMRRIYERPEEARQVGSKASVDLRERHSLDRTAEFIAQRLERIPEAARALLRARGALDHAAAIASLAPGDSLERSPEGPAVVRLLRRLLRRALWPELVEQRRLDAAMVESLRRLIDIHHSELHSRGGGSSD
jgi:glycosyltransferase involved in cell wall biosynthesis